MVKQELILTICSVLSLLVVISPLSLAYSGKASRAVRWQLDRGGRGKVTGNRETLPQSAAYSSHSESELHPCLWSSLLNRVRVEKYSEEKMARHRYSSDRTTTTRARLVEAMLCYMCDDRERTLLQFDQIAENTPLHARFYGRPIRRQRRDIVKNKTTGPGMQCCC